MYINTMLPEQCDQNLRNAAMTITESGGISYELEWRVTSVTEKRRNPLQREPRPGIFDQQPLHPSIQAGERAKNPALCYGIYFNKLDLARHGR